MPDQGLALTRYFAALPDPRVNRTKKHLLSDIPASPGVPSSSARRRSPMGATRSRPSGKGAKQVLRRVFAASPREEVLDPGPTIVRYVAPTHV